MAKRFPEATQTMHLSIPVIAAAAALQHREAARAVELLEPARPYDHAPFAEFWPLFLRGQAYLQLKNGAAAAAEFQSIVDSQGEVPTSLLYPLAHLGLARAQVLTNDTAAARETYARLLTFWQEPDSKLLPLDEARAEYARLQH